MYIIEVIPIAILPPQIPQLLSYYHGKPLLKGAVVEVSMGNRNIQAVVISATSIEGQKASLKKSAFQLKKISKVLSEIPLVSDFQFKIALWLSKNYYSPLGLCLKTALPPFFLKKNYELPASPTGRRITNDDLEKSSFKPTILLSRARDIIKNIEPEVKKILKNKNPFGKAQGKQVLIIAPEILIAKFFYDYFARLAKASGEARAGYYETALVHSKIPAGQALKNWNKISSGKAEIIIGTRQALFGPFANLGLIIVEDPANGAYKSDMSPRYNTPDLAMKIAEIHSADILFVGQMPDALGYHYIKNGLCSLNDQRTVSKTEIKFENMVQEIKSGNFSILSRGLRSSLSKAVTENKKILLFSTRKGYSTSLVCENCGFYFNCPKCSIPFKVYRTPETLFICNRCGTTEKIPDSCPNCHSSKLKSAGFAGSEKIKEELIRILEIEGLKKNIIIIDSDSDIDPVDDNSSIYISTQAIFSYRYKINFDLIGIPSLDSLTTIPDFRAEEQLFLQFEKLLDFGPEIIIAQTYNPENRLQELLKKRDYGQFYDSEFMARRLFSYPPFTRLIKASISSPDKAKAVYEARILNEKLKMAVIQKKLGDSVKISGPSPAFVEKEKNLYIYNIILKISPDLWPDDILRFIPSHWTIDADPKSIL